MKRLAATSSPETEDADEGMDMSPGLEWVSQMETSGEMDLAFGLVGLTGANLKGFRSIMIPNGAISSLNGVAVAGETPALKIAAFPLISLCSPDKRMVRLFPGVSLVSMPPASSIR